jgi:FkbM family methyltransferase
MKHTVMPLNTSRARKRVWAVEFILFEYYIFEILKKNLIYDVGFHLGQDTKFYLDKGYQIVGVEASPDLYMNARDYFAGAIARGELIMVNYAIADKEGDELDFYLSERTEWNSLNINIASRLNHKFDVIKVKTTNLPVLFDKFGVPYYCKIDIEGYDEVAIKGLVSFREIPKFISCETECLGEFEVADENEVLATLNALKDVGYKKFKLVDQESLFVLGRSKFYSVKENEKPGFVFRIIRKAFHLVNCNLEKYTPQQILSFKHGFHFQLGSTGPFGSLLDGKWVSYEEARDLLLFHREDFFKANAGDNRYTIWCDWHATY